jgi:hypothetical protein
VPSIFGKFFGNTISSAAGFAAGASTARTLEPGLQDLTNEAWAHHQSMPLDALLLAEGVAQGQVGYAWAQGEAERTGINKERFDHAVDVANTGPGIGEAFNLWRRGALDEAGFRRAATRAALEPEWINALVKVKDLLLTPAEIATAVHRGIMRDPSLIVTEPPATPGKVPQVAESSIKPAPEAAGSGIDHERLRVLVGITGLPPGLVQMLELLNRGEVTEDDVRRAVAQSNLRNEYMDVVLALRRRLLTPHEYEEAALRGLIERGTADAGAALSGMEAADARLLYDTMGRPLTVHQLVTALARGGQFGGTYDDVPEPYRDAIRRSNTRPEYARLAYANRYTYPSAFVLRGLAQAGDLGNAAAVEQILLEIGWPPNLAAKVAPQWVAGGTTADTHVSKAQTQLWSTLHSSYLAGDTSDATALDKLGQAGVPAAQRDDVLAVWKHERELDRGRLTAAQLRKAWAKNVPNPKTGVPWTRDEALAELLDRGWNQQDANTFLDTPTGN